MYIIYLYLKCEGWKIRRGENMQKKSISFQKLHGSRLKSERGTKAKNGLE